MHLIGQATILSTKSSQSTDIVKNHLFEIIILCTTIQTYKLCLKQIIYLFFLDIFLRNSDFESVNCMRTQANKDPEHLYIYCTEIDDKG